jgi:hypothetical protein
MSTFGREADAIAKQEREWRFGQFDWLEPVSLPEGLSPVASLDIALLPTALAPWVCDISERMQTPPDYVGVAALTALGSVWSQNWDQATVSH